MEEHAVRSGGVATNGHVRHGLPRFNYPGVPAETDAYSIGADRMSQFTLGRPTESANTDNSVTFVRGDMARDFGLQAICYRDGE